VIRLLIVDDSALLRRLLSGVFAECGEFETVVARDGLEAIEKVHSFRPDVVTLDVNMPLMDGLTCLDRIMLERPCPVVMVSSLTEAGADATLRALELGAIDFIAKPEGAVSLAIDEFGPLLVAKVRAASKVRLRSTLRLTEKLKLRRTTARPEAPARLADSRGFAAIPTAGPVDGVVLVGSSTGGPPALDALLSPLPEDFPWPILVAQHMPSSFTGALSRRLDKLCALEVIEVTQPMPLTPGRVYIGKGDADIIVAARSGRVVVTAAPASVEERWHPSVNRLVTTALDHLGASRLIGILMTGMGNDGAAAMTRLSAEGGRTIAEAEETAVVWGMPGALVELGGAQVVAPLGDIARHLMAWTP
jgi:two-component system chemotaxis response regulator CheB